jgi:hypothetical protein
MIYLHFKNWKFKFEIMNPASQNMYYTNIATVFYYP